MRFRGLVLLLPVLMPGQLTTGLVEGTVHGPQGEPAKYVSLTIVNGAGFRIAIQTSSDGGFTFSAPYGQYTVSSSSPPPHATAVPVTVEPLQTSFLDLIVESSGRLHRSGMEPDLRERSTSLFTRWLGNATSRTTPLGFSLQSIVAGEEPSSIAVPTNFTGLTDNRLALISQRALSWTNTQFKLQGLDATDSYQPGRPSILPDVQSIAQIVVRTGAGLLVSNSYGSEVGAFLATPEAAWHGSLATFGTGSALSSNNLPEMIGLVRRPQRFNWFTRGRIELGGPVTQWADLFGSWAGQWASQAIGTAQPGQNQQSRMSVGHIRGDFRAGSHDRIDAEYSGSRLRLSDWGLPAGIESLTSRRMSPEFDSPDGFADEAENDRFDFLQTGWTHQHGAGTLEIRYGYSRAHLGSWPASIASPNQSRIELLGSTVTGSPPLSNFAQRPRHEIAIAWRPPVAVAR